MHQRKRSFIHKLAKDTHKVKAAHHLLHGSHREFHSKYVISEPSSDTNMLSDYEHMMQQYLQQSSDEESHQYDTDDVLPDTMVG